MQAVKSLRKGIQDYDKNTGGEDRSNKIKIKIEKKTTENTSWIQL